MKQPLVSVIIPVYGVEAYLDNCVTSVVSQTYKNLEIFLIDDGSPDNCPKICDEWAKKDSRIVVIHKGNGGQGAARNAALDIMTGDYVLFVDGDDRILPTMVEKMLNATSDGKTDLVLCGLTVNNTLRTVNTNWYSQSKLYTPEEIIFEYLTSKKILTGPVCKLIHKRLISDIRFPEFRANEDAYIMHQFIGNCNCAYVLNEHLYIQNIREGSTEQSPFNANKMHLIDCAYALRSYIDKKYPKYSPYVKDKIAKDCLVLLDAMYIQNVNKKHSDCEDIIRNTLKEEIKILDKNTKIYKRVDMYLNKHSIYVCRVKTVFIKTKIRRAIKKIIIKLKSVVGDAK